VNIRETRAGTPALQERFLGRIVGIVGIAQQVEESTDQFIPDLIEHRHE
jgi:hypothetical protein